MNQDQTQDSRIRTDIPHPRKSIYSLFIKRLLDILLSGTAILVLSPVLLVLCILELIFHGSPVLYVSTRPGKDEKLFKLYKFRSMTNKTDENGNLLPSKERLTPFGRFIRRYSLDELAELFNIFNGTMSIIGPRPLTEEYLAYYNERHHYRHSVRPGLACVRVDGDDTLTNSSWTWNDQFENDIYYVENISFGLDVKMLLKMVKIVFSKSEMRTNADRAKFDGHNLLETRSLREIEAEEEKKAGQNNASC